MFVSWTNDFFIVKTLFSRVFKIFNSSIQIEGQFFFIRILNTRQCDLFGNESHTKNRIKVFGLCGMGYVLVKKPFQKISLSDRHKQFLRSKDLNKNFSIKNQK